MIKEDPDTHTKTPFIGDLLPVFFSLSVRANINGQALHEEFGWIRPKEKISPCCESFNHEHLRDILVLEDYNKKKDSFFFLYLP